MSRLSVLKFGGSSLARPEQIVEIARKIRERRNSGERLIVVVSAMGSTTDELVRLAHQVSPLPNRRELDMLLTTGERVSMALLSMALQDVNVPSISLTGSQAGILTDGSFSNAKIVDIKPIRVEQSLRDNRVVVLAGFQGVEPNTKEITTLGRGGSDTTAVALAAHFKANSCEILKDVDGVFSADPTLIKGAKKFDKVPISSLMEMCFWGAKVLHYRSVRLANRKNVSLVVGRSDTFTIGTRVTAKEEKIMFEQYELVSVNSHENIRRVTTQAADNHDGLQLFKEALEKSGVAWPQVLATRCEGGEFELIYTADSASATAVENCLNGSHLNGNNKFNVSGEMSSVTATCFGAVATDLPLRLAARLRENGISTFGTVISPLSVTFFVRPETREKAIALLHEALPMSQ